MWCDSKSEYIHVNMPDDYHTCTQLARREGQIDSHINGNNLSIISLSDSFLVGSSRISIGNAVILLRLAIGNLSIVHFARVNSVGAEVVLDIARADESSVQVIKGGVAVDLEGAVTTDIVDSGGSGTKVTVEALQVLCIEEAFVSMPVLREALEI